MGLGTFTYTIRSSFSDEMKRTNIYDVNIKSTSTSGFDIESDEFKEVINYFDYSSYETYSVIDACSVEASMTSDDFLNSYVLPALDKIEDDPSYNIPPALMEGIRNYIITNTPKDEYVYKITSSDIYTDNSRMIIDDFSKKQDNINNTKVIEGRYPTSNTEVAVLRGTYSINEHEIGDVLNILNVDKTVVGIIESPYYFTKEEELDIKENTLNDIFYLDYNTLDTSEFTKVVSDQIASFIQEHYVSNAPLDSIKRIIDEILKNAENVPTFTFPQYTDIFIKLNGRDDYILGSKKYTKFIDSKTSAIKNNEEKLNIKVLTLEENISYARLTNYLEKLNVIEWILPLFFLVVSALVVSTTMERMVNEDRLQIGCFVSLGSQNIKIYSKYIAITLLATLLGSLFGSIMGIYLFPPILYQSFNVNFNLPVMSHSYSVLIGMLSIIGILVSSLGVTIFTIANKLKEKSSELLHSKSPSGGTRILLERLPFWKRLPFKLKSSFRNLSRYKMNFVMTVVCVSGSVALIFAGLSILDVIFKTKTGEGFGESIKPVAIFIIIFSLVLSGFVLYNLTNMNISERGREIATLKVLGYTNKEVSFYIYREVFIMVLVGCLFGIPLGLVLMVFLLYYLGFGNVGMINVGTYFYPIIAMVLFVCFVDLLLLNKILKIDMISSLKSVD